MNNGHNGTGRRLGRSEPTMRRAGEHWLREIYSREHRAEPATEPISDVVARSLRHSSVKVTEKYYSSSIKNDDSS